MIEALATRTATRLGPLGIAAIDLPIAEEVPVAFAYNGVAHAVMMATPADLQAFALGFSLAEAIVATPGEVLDVAIEHRPEGIALDIRITARRAALLGDRRRAQLGPTGCGLCGTERLADVLRPLEPLPPSAPVPLDALRAALRALPQHQPLNRAAGAVHAAAWAALDGRIVAAAEDVGRHNALDKLIGKLSQGKRPDGVLLLTSRCSWEMAAKAITARMPALAAISAPTALALDAAEAAGLGVIGLARADGLTIYAHPERFQGQDAAERAA